MVFQGKAVWGVAIKVTLRCQDEDRILVGIVVVTLNGAEKDVRMSTLHPSPSRRLEADRRSVKKHSCRGSH